MNVFAAYQTGLETYLEDFVTLEIIDVELNSNAGEVLNTEETAWFDVQIHNTGPLQMADVTVRLRGRNGAQVRNTGAASPWEHDFTTAVGQFPLVPGHNGNNLTTNTGRFSFLAPSAPQPRRTLVDVCIVDWVAEFSHVHHNHSFGSDRVTAAHEDAVRAQ